MKFRVKSPADKAAARRMWHRERKRRLVNWHTWFAWYPIRLTEDEREVRWLELVMRKGIDRGDDADYFDFYKWVYTDNIFSVIKDG